MKWSEAVSWCRAHRTIAIVIAAISALALMSAYGAWSFRGKLQEAKRAEKGARQESKEIQREAEIQSEAFRKAIGATDPRLGEVLREIKGVRAGLAAVEAERRELWIPPAVDNGELAARFDRAVGALQ